MTTLPAKSMLGQAEHPYLLATGFAEVTHALYATGSLSDVLDRIGQLSVEIIEPCDAASVSLRSGSRSVAHAASDSVAASVDALQIELNTGPSLEAMTKREQVYVEDLTVPGRFPRLSSEVASRASEMRSIVAYVLGVRREDAATGSLNLYSHEPAAFDDDDRALGAIFAAHVSIVVAAKLSELHGHDTEEQLQQALSSRDLIGQAKGILMERQRLTADGAFDVLRRASQHLNIKLRDIAELLVETGDLSVLEPTAGASPEIAAG